jgi:hypothetical protein
MTTIKGDPIHGALADDITRAIRLACARPGLDAHADTIAREAIATVNAWADSRATPPPESVPSEAETGSCGICGCDVTTDDEDCDDDGELVEGRVYMLPVTNGVYSTPTRTLLCEPCAFDMADRNSEAAEDV